VSGLGGGCAPASGLVPYALTQVLLLSGLRTGCARLQVQSRTATVNDN
jgi:hypothetical protein